jgi:hypothetical protein
VTHQTKLDNHVQQVIQDRPEFIWELTPLENEMKDTWPAPLDKGNPPREGILIAAMKALRKLTLSVIGRRPAEIPDDRHWLVGLGVFLFTKKLHKVHLH